jgi:Integrase core domain
MAPRRVQASQRIRPRNGSQIRSWKPAAGNKLPTISFVTGTGPAVRSSSEGCYQWAIRDRPTSPHSPWQDGYAEGLIGSIRRECLDHVVVFSERHLRHLRLSYMTYYNGARSHLSLEKDAPVSRAVDRAGQILCRPTLGGLHHLYAWI